MKKEGMKASRIAAHAAETLGRLPTSPIASDHPLDVAINNALSAIAPVLNDLTGAETMTKSELRSSVVTLVQQAKSDALILEGVLVELPSGGQGPVAEALCIKKCLPEWEQCFEDFWIDADFEVVVGDEIDVADLSVLFKCSIVFEECLADCLG